MNGGYRLRINQAVLRGNQFAVLGDKTKQGAQVVQVEQEQPLVIRQFKGDFQYPRLGIRKTQEPAEQVRAHLRNRSAHRVSRFPVHVPEHHGIRFINIIFNANLGYPLLKFFVGDACRRETGHIAFHIGHKHRNPHPRKAFR